MLKWNQDEWGHFFFYLEISLFFCCTINTLILGSSRSSKRRGSICGITKKIVIVDQRDICGCDDISSEPSAVKCVDWWYCGIDGWAFDVDIALWSNFVYVKMQNTTVFVALFNNIITNFLIPTPFRFFSWVKHVSQHETLCGYWGICSCKLLLLLLSLVLVHRMLGCRCGRGYTVGSW